MIVGKSMPEEGKAKCLAFVNKYDARPKRRLFELLKSQGMQPNQLVTFFSDGSETERNLRRRLNPESEHWLDWFHIGVNPTLLSPSATAKTMSVQCLRLGSVDALHNFDSLLGRRSPYCTTWGKPNITVTSRKVDIAERRRSLNMLHERV